MFKALVLDQIDGKTKAEVRDLEVSDLPNEPLLVDVDYSSINYKDGLAITGTGRIVSQFPMVPGIDLAGTVTESHSDEFSVGDTIIMTGWSVGERFWGGLSEKARLKPEWCVPLPPGMTSHDAMVIGTAGLTAMLCVMALEDAGVTPESGEVVVSGAAGGVGSVALRLLAALGYEAVAITGRAEMESYLIAMGASRVISRDSMQESAKPLEKQRWAGGIDTVGDTILARMLAETHYGGAIAACGLAGGYKLPTTVMPFILRNVRLQGVDSVMCPKETRTVAWQRLQQLLSSEDLVEMSQTISLEEVPEYAEKIVNGQVRGRTLVKLTAQ
ncbi:MDR family oxidoreductase [Neptunomonas phycophila]|uniref:acrylyl-CoA reductase (NADPH) n=1 Tax=Neptunomonas phycophila TaxID=1572645 RepID=UPI0015BCE3CD|nr:MDR family oxidoreductase [Neptunomonas phycophila]QLE98346.1 oxidoreductase [Neptunomonas phycophila]